MELYRGIVQDKTGAIVNGATVTVYESDGSTIAAIYDKNGSSISNPFLSGHNRSEGEYEFAAPGGEYVVNVDNGVGSPDNFPITLFSLPDVQQVYASKAAAVLSQPVSGKSIQVLGDDGGNFYGVTGAAAGTYSDNGGAYCGTVFIPTGGDGSSAFVRRFDSYVNCYWFGVLGDGVTNNNAQIKLHIDFCYENKYTAYYPSGTYLISYQIRIPGPITIVGDGRGEDSASANPSTGATVFKSSSAAGAFLIQSYNSGSWINGVVMRSFVIDCVNTSSIGIHGRTIASCIFDNILILRCTSAGIRLDDANGNISVYNKIDNFYYNAGANSLSASSIGILFASVGAGYGGVVQTILGNITTNTSNGDGIYFSGCDNNIIQKHQGFIQPGGTGVSLRFANGVYIHGRNNVVFYIVGPIHAENSTYGNRIVHGISEGMYITHDPGAQLHYETVDYVNSGLYKTHSYKMSDELSISSTSMSDDGVNAVKAIAASQWGCINFSDSATGVAYINISAPYDWKDGEVTGIELVYSSDVTNASASFNVSVRASSLQTTAAIATPNIEHIESILVNDNANRINSSILSFASPLQYSYGDSVLISIRRNGSDAADTAVGYMQLLCIKVIYKSFGPSSGGSGPYSITPPFI